MAVVKSTSRVPHTRTFGLVLFLGVVGSISTALWIGSTRLGAPRLSVLSASVLFSLALCLALTSLNLGLRWFRWHFLIRRFTRRIVTRDSLVVYLATLPAIVTPFFIGELIRVVILRRKAGSKTAHLAWVWLIERIMDAAVLSSFFLLAVSTNLGLLSLPLVAILVFLLFRLLLEDRRTRNVLTIGSIALGTTIMAWLLPVVALLATLRLCSQAVPFSTGVKAFSAGTLTGGVSGFPLGVFVAGSAMIRELLLSGVSADVGVLSILVYRIGTAWYALFLGVASFLFWRGRLANIMRNDSAGHFDEIAHEYEGQIPQHVREGLLAKKTGLIEQHLQGLGITPGAKGLDLGCGQGWYLAELARAGYRMCGADYSARQLQKASANLPPDQRSAGPLLQADGQALPFKDQSFDFVYSINAFHHFPSRAAQVRAATEIVRVLRPGGTFVLHEINTLNPVFRLYVGYLFPLLKQIDEGTERWILPAEFPSVAGATWLPEVRYFTFMPDFVPRALQGLLGGIESSLERSALRRYSAHYQACLVKQ